MCKLLKKIKKKKSQGVEFPEQFPIDLDTPTYRRNGYVTRIGTDENGDRVFVIQKVKDGKR